MSERNCEIKIKIGEWGEYTIVLKDSKKYLKHKWKDEPLKDYQ